VFYKRLAVAALLGVSAWSVPACSRNSTKVAIPPSPQKSAPALPVVERIGMPRSELDDKRALRAAKVEAAREKVRAAKEDADRLSDEYIETMLQATEAANKAQAMLNAAQIRSAGDPRPESPAAVEAWRKRGLQELAELNEAQAGVKDWNLKVRRAQAKSMMAKSKVEEAKAAVRDAEAGK
jgi:hypothetical protein